MSTAAGTVSASSRRIRGAMMSRSWCPREGGRWCGQWPGMRWFECMRRTVVQSPQAWQQILWWTHYSGVRAIVKYLASNAKASGKGTPRWIRSKPPTTMASGFLGLGFTHTISR